MLPEFVSLPFSIPNLYQGLAEARGILRTNAAGLVLEFEVKDGVVGMLKSGIKEVRLAIDEVSHIDLKEGWFRTRVFIRANRLAALSSIPGNESGKIALQIARKDRTLAKALVSGLKLSLSEKELERLNQDRSILDR